MTCLSNQFLFHIKFVIFVSLQVPCFFNHKRNNTYSIRYFTNFESLAFMNIDNYCEEHDIITPLGLLGKQALELFENGRDSIHPISQLHTITWPLCFHKRN
jgi:hypothetical protein